MNLQNQQAFFKYFTEEMEKIMLKKGNDYSNEDRLSNFKLSGSIIGQSGEQCCLNLIAVKVARLGQLIGAGKLPNNESVHDTLLDLANYTLLLAMLVDEQDGRQSSIGYLTKNVPPPHVNSIDDLPFLV